jgi:integrase
MTLSQDILKGLALFHLDRADATWAELKAQLLDVAHSFLEQRYDEGGLSAYDEIYEDLSISLAKAAAMAPLRINQHKALDFGREIVKGAHARLKGNTKPLVQVIERIESLDHANATTTHSLASPAPSGQIAAPITFEELAELFIKERKGNVEDSSLRSIQSSCRTLSGLLGTLDIRSHERADMVALKEKAMDGRKLSTVNKLITQLSTVTEWAVNNGLIPYAYTKGLKAERGADSQRIPFSPEQMAAIMSYANALPGSDWKRWVLSLGVITGARIGELYQLTQDDVIVVDGITLIDLNKDGDGKTLKNSFSIRQVPLVDGAYGFNLAAFHEWVKSEPGRLFKAKAHYFNKPANEAVRKPLGLPSGSNQSFHSLRHSMSGILKAAVIPDVISQSILGHSSGTITYDLYAGSQRIPIKTLHEAMEKAFKLAQ